MPRGILEALAGICALPNLWATSPVTAHGAPVLVAFGVSTWIWLVESSSSASAAFPHGDITSAAG